MPGTVAVAGLAIRAGPVTVTGPTSTTAGAPVICLSGCLRLVPWSFTSYYATAMGADRGLVREHGATYC